MSFEKKHLLKYQPTGMVALEINYAMVAMALDMVGNLGVVFIFLLGESWRWGLLLVLMFYGAQRIVTGLTSVWVGYFVYRRGYRRSILLSMFLTIMKLFLLSLTTSQTLWLLIPALVAGGIHLGLYDVAFHGLFLGDNDDERICEQNGLLELLANIGGVLSPLAAGLIVTWFGFPKLFWLAMGLLLLSTIPLWLMPHHDKRFRRYDFVESIEIFKREKTLVASVFWWHFQDSVLIFVWPIFLYSMVTNFSLFGLFGSMAMVASGISNFVAGKIYDKKPPRRGHWGLTGLISLAWMGMVFSGKGWWAAGANTMRKLASPLWWMKFKRYALMKGETMPAVEFGVVWVWVVTLGYLAGIGVAMGLVLITGQWYSMLVPAMTGVLLSSLSIEKADEA